MQRAEEETIENPIWNRRDGRETAITGALIHYDYDSFDWNN